MITLRIKEWVQMYEVWKAANPNMQGEDLKSVRVKMVRGCKGKAQYESYGEAMAIVNDLPARKGRALHAYRCPICGNWHVGNTSLYKIGRAA